MKKILHLVPVYKKYSETFIWRHITDVKNASGYQCTVVVSKCTESISHIEPLLVIDGKDSSVFNKAIFKIKGLYSCPSFFGRSDLLNIIDENKPDIIHAHFGYFIRDVFEIARSYKNKTFVISFHGTDLNVYVRHRPEVIAYMRLLCQFDNVNYVFPSEFLRDVAVKIMKLKSNLSNLKVIRNSVSLDFVNAWVNGNKFLGNCVNLLSVGRLEKVKGFDYVIRAIPQLLKNNLNVRYTIIGDGSQYSNLKRLAIHLGVGEHVIFLGRKNHQLIIEMIKESDIYIQPSVTLKNGQEESFGVSALEAGVSGIPIIVTNSGGLKSVIDVDNVNHYCINQKDEYAISSTVLNIFMKKPKKNLNSIYLDRFNARQILNEWLKLYE